MNNSIVKNHITITKSLFMEGTKATQSSKYQKMVKWLVLLLFAIFAGIAVVLLISGQSIFSLLGEFIFLGALFFWLIVMLPGSRNRSRYKLLCRNLANPPERFTSFFSDSFSVRTETGKETIFHYEDITELKETKHLYILVTNKKQGILLDKTGFTQGTIEQVKAFLE